jgi:DNA-binding transcriptional ArsR family regulator
MAEEVTATAAVPAAKATLQGLSQPTISHHLKVLREAGIITCARHGTWVYYRLVPAILDRMGALLTAPVS